MQDNDNRLSRLDRLLGDVRDEVARLSEDVQRTIVTADGPPVSEAHAHALVLAGLIGEHRLPLAHFMVGENFVSVSVDSLADVAAWAHALGEDSFESYRVGGKIGVKVQGSVHGTEIDVLHHRDSPIPRVVVPAEGSRHHRSPLCSLESLAGSAVTS